MDFGKPCGPEQQCTLHNLHCAYPNCFKGTERKAVLDKMFALADENAKEAEAKRQEWLQRTGGPFREFQDGDKTYGLFREDNGVYVHLKVGGEYYQFRIDEDDRPVWLSNELIAALAQESPKGEWSHEPPKEPGAFWHRVFDGFNKAWAEPTVQNLRIHGGKICLINWEVVPRRDAQWWPIRISEPPIQTPKESIE